MEAHYGHFDPLDTIATQKFLDSRDDAAKLITNSKLWLGKETRLASGTNKLVVKMPASARRKDRIDHGHFSELRKR